MKKTYISPAALTIQLSTCHMMAESLTINTTADSSQTINSQEQILTKEMTDVNLWDNEW